MERLSLRELRGLSQISRFVRLVQGQGWAYVSPVFFEKLRKAGFKRSGCCWGVVEVNGVRCYGSKLLENSKVPWRFYNWKGGK